jgi:hypothetical protein
MTATTASDPKGVEYYFEETSGNSSGTDSDWQDSVNYTDSGLNADTEYSYRVKARDKSADQKENSWSSPSSATTDPNTFPPSEEGLDADFDSGQDGSSYAPDTLIIEQSVGSSYRAYVVAYILEEAGIAAASDGTIVPTWDETPDKVAYSSVFFANVNQVEPVGVSDSNSTTSLSTLATDSLATANGDLVSVAGTCGSTGSYSTNNDFTEGIELTISSSDAVAGYKQATGTNEIPSITHSDLNRQVVVGFVVQNN